MRFLRRSLTTYWSVEMAVAADVTSQSTNGRLSEAFGLLVQLKIRLNFHMLRLGYYALSDGKGPPSCFSWPVNRHPHIGHFPRAVMETWATTD
jgi:hypothetical protein